MPEDGQQLALTMQGVNMTQGLNNFIIWLAVERLRKKKVYSYSV